MAYIPFNISEYPLSFYPIWQMCVWIVMAVSWCGTFICYFGAVTLVATVANVCVYFACWRWNFWQLYVGSNTRWHMISIHDTTQLHAHQIFSPPWSRLSRTHSVGCSACAYFPSFGAVIGLTPRRVNEWTTNTPNAHKERGRESENSERVKLNSAEGKPK